MNKGKPLHTFASELVAETVSKQQTLVNVPEFLEDLEIKHDTIVYHGDKNYMLTPLGFKQLIKDRLGGNIALFNDKVVSKRTRDNYMEDLANANKGKAMLVRNDGSEITSFHSEHHMYVDNFAIAKWLLKNDAFDTPNCVAHTSNISKDGAEFYCRIISPDHWNFGDSPNNYYSGLVLHNDETGRNPFGVSIALARVQCFNYTVSENLIPVTKWGSVEEVLNAISMGAGKLALISSEMHDSMGRFDTVEFSHPEIVFRVLANQMKLPNYMLDETQQYWQREGAVPTIFAIIQAITWGSQSLTAGKRKGKANYYGQIEAERNIMDWGQALFEEHQKGGDVNDFISSSELISKAKVVTALQTRNEWSSASELVLTMEADGYTV